MKWSPVLIQGAKVLQLSKFEKNCLNDLIEGGHDANLECLNEDCLCPPDLTGIKEDWLWLSNTGDYDYHSFFWIRAQIDAEVNLHMLWPTHIT